MAYHIFRLATLSLAIVVGLAITPASADTSGSFKGLSNHITTGNVTVSKAADGSSIITLAGNFTFDGAPDPWIGLGNGGTYKAGTNFEKLRSNAGEQVYKVPASIDVSDFSEVYIWCEKFSVPLGVASLK